MTSKNLYFKLMKEDLKRRLWAVSLITLGFFFLYPVVAAFTAGNIKDFPTYEKGLEHYAQGLIEWLSFENGIMVLMMVLASLICGLSSFSYLNSRCKVDFYHSIPVRRERLYVVNYVNGILILAVPYVISAVLAVVVGIANGVEGARLWSVAFTACGLHLTYFILMYSTVVIAAMMTGNLIIGILGSAVLTFYIPLATSLTNGLFSMFFHTYDWSRQNTIFDMLVRLSPVVEYIMQAQKYGVGGLSLTAVLAALLVSAVLAALGCILYKKRPSESAGKAMAFAVTCPVIRILIVILSSIGFGGFFWSLRESTGWMVFGALCGAVIAHCVIEIIYYFDFKKLFGHKKQLTACIAISIAVLLVFCYDIFRYDTYMPKADKVKYASVHVDNLNNWTSYGIFQPQTDGSYTWESTISYEYIRDHMQYEDVENVLNIAASGVENVRLDRERQRADIREEAAQEMEAVNTTEQQNDDICSGVSICYTLNSGRKVYRRYNINLDENMPHMEKLYASEQYQKGTFPLMSIPSDSVVAVRYKNFIKHNRTSKNEASVLSTLTEAEKKELLETYQDEFKSMTLQQMEQELPVGGIRFSCMDSEAAIAWWNMPSEEGDKDRRMYGTSFTEYDYYPVYSSFEKTITLLEKHHVEISKNFEDFNVSSVTMTRQVVENGEWKGEKVITVTAPEEIEELCRVMIPRSGAYYNSLFKADSTDIEVQRDSEDEKNFVGACFPKGSVPEFVESEFEKTTPSD